MHESTLAERRRALAERCAEQRTGLAAELQVLRPSAALGHPLSYPILGYIVGHKKLVLGALGTLLGLALTRRTRLAGLTGSAASAMRAWRMAQGALALLGRDRQ
jgi:hypothetical protein